MPTSTMRSPAATAAGIGTEGLAEVALVWLLPTKLTVEAGGALDTSMFCVVVLLAPLSSVTFKVIVQARPQRRCATAGVAPVAVPPSLKVHS